MKDNLTYGQLMNIDNDLKSVMKDNAGVTFLLRDKINNFYKQFNNPLLAIKRKHHELLSKHIVPDEKGNPSFIEKEDKSIEYVWATASSKQTFDKESQDFFKREVTVIHSL